ncbi:MAG TPA: CRTAC1 family protein [Bryobacteraceae bacterium]|nr:CRTAC1 family protein [Bryobacteraceae bacterium]
MAKAKGIVVFGLVPLLFVAGAGVVSVKYLDSTGNRFFDEGKEILGDLTQLSHAMKARDYAAVEGYFSPQYQGSRLGVMTLKEVALKDGIHKQLFSSDGSSQDRAGALAEWRAYLDSFDSIDELTFHVHRLEKWGSRDDMGAVVRFELIGTPHGASYAGIDRGYFRLGFKAGDKSLLITSGSLVSGDRSIGDKPHFIDVAADAGVNFRNQYYPGFINQKLKFAMIRYGPAGITAADYDNDGFYDLFIPDGVESKLFRNLGNGKFEDVTAKAGLSGLDGVSVALFADFDNDGHKDLFVSRTFKPNQLFHNNGDGTFTDVTKKSGIAEDCCTTVASWADYDNDGYLDLYVGRYLDPRLDIPTTFYARNGLKNQLYHNNHDGTFTNVTEKAGVGEVGLCLGTVWGDYNGDGWPDLYVVNDFGRKTLYRNNGDGTFTDVTARSGTLAYGAGMNASMGDYDNDGKLDIYVTNIRSEDAWYAEWPTVGRYMINSWRQGVWVTDMPLYMQIFRQSGFNFIKVFQDMASGNNLLRNKGDGTFEDTTVKNDANPIGWFWGASFADFDNDGWQDIYAADGWVYNDKDTEIELDFLNNVVSEQKLYKTGILFDPAHFGHTSWHGWEHNRYLRNKGDGSFEEVGRAAGNDLLLNSRGVAVADFWNRGVMDIAVSASTDRHALLRNDVGAGRHWLQVELVGTKSNRDAVGARITIRNKGKLQMREIALGDGYGSENSLRQHFGLGEATSVDEISVKWPASKMVQTFQNVAGNRIIQITEGSSQIVEKNYPKVARR